MSSVDCSPNLCSVSNKQIPNYVAEKVRELLDEELLAVVDEFNKHYGL